MAVAFVANKANSGNGGVTSKNLAYPSSVTAAAGLVACVCVEDSTATITGVSDDVNGSWTEAVSNSHTAPSNNRQAIWYYENASSGTTTVTVTLSASSTLSLSLFEISGAATSGSLGDTSFATGSTLEVSPGAVTPTVADNIIFAQANSYTNSLSAKTGYTLGYANSSSWYSANQYKITASTSSEDPYLSAAATSGFNAVAAVFQAAASGAFTLTADAGSYSVSGTAAGLLAARLLTASTSSYTLTGTDAGVFVGRNLSAGAGSYTVTGDSVSLLTTRTISADGGSYTVTGQDAGLLRGRYLSAGSGVYTVTGQDITSLATRLITASSGSYTLSGTDATLIYTPITSDYVLTANAGSYALSGGTADLLATRLLTSGEGSYVVTGQVLQLLKGYMLSVEAGSYAVTGSDAAFLRTYNISAGPGVYTIAGQNVTLTYSGAITSDGLNYIIMRRRRRSCK